MNQDTFRKLLKDLGDYYGLEKIVTKRRFDLWARRVEHVPDEAIGFIYDKLCEEKETIPRNVPKWVKEYHHQWNSANPDKQMQYAAVRCDDCGGRGFLWYYKFNSGGLRYRFMAVCAACENWRRHIGFVTASKIAHWRKSDLIMHGYDVDEFVFNPDQDTIPAEWIGQQAATAVKRI